MVWWSRVGDNLDTVTTTVAKTVAPSPPAPENLCLPCLTPSYQKPLAPVKGARGGERRLCRRGEEAGGQEVGR